MKQKKIKKTIGYEDSVLLAQKLASCGLPMELDGKRNRVEFSTGEGQTFAILRLPMMWPLQNEMVLPEKKIGYWHDNIPPYLLFLVQAGYAAIGFFINDQCVIHENIRRYMVRKKQGRAQINYLKTKGKSRAGSRIRLNESRAFFDDINSTLKDHYSLAGWQAILFSCTPLLWGHLFSNDPPPPFSKKDQRLKKVPMDVQRPGFEELMRVHRHLRQGELLMFADIPPAYRPLFEPFI